MGKDKVILIGVGGATCSGKTTLAKHLRALIPDSVIIHQDDFAPPQELVPVHPKYNVQDWDSASGAIDWPRLVEFLKHVKDTGTIPPDHRSHDHLNEQKDVPIDPEVKDKWRTTFDDLKRARELDSDSRVVWGLVDGFLLYWNEEVRNQLDVRLMLRVSEPVLRQRRHERHGYHTAEGSLWRDPPRYWEEIVWPAYVDAHKDMFEDRDIESGKVGYDIHLLENQSMTEMVEKSCGLLKEYLQRC